MLDAVGERLAGFLESLVDRPAWTEPDAQSIAARFREPLPAEPGELEPLLDAVFDETFSQGFNTTSPGYLAFIPGGGLPVSAVADLIAGVVNRYVSVWQAAPAAAEIEATVVRWICEMVGYPSSAGGCLTTGGSLANWSAVVTARRCRLPENFLNGTIYVSDQAHHSVAKGAMLAGFPPANVRAIPSDDRFRIRIDALIERIAADRREGRRPFLVVGNAGTVHTGAVDDLAALADVAQSENLWLHLDAAYGGFFSLTERGRTVLRGIDRADSISLDPHKGLFLPFGTGTLLVRNAGDLERAHRLDADYLPAMQQDPDRVDFCRISPELSRDFRGLRLWLPIKLFGIDAFRRELDEKLDLAQRAADELRETPNVEIVAEPQLSLVAFRLRSSGGPSLEERNALNRRFLERINAGRRVMLTGTLIDGEFVVRICVLSFRTHAERMDDCLQAVRNAAESVEGF